MLSRHSDGPSSLWQQKTYVGVGSPLKGMEGVDIVVCDGSASMNDRLRYVMYLMFDGFHSIILNYSFYSEFEEWAALF